MWAMLCWRPSIRFRIGNSNRRPALSNKCRKKRSKASGLRASGGFDSSAVSMACARSRPNLNSLAYSCSTWNHATQPGSLTPIIPRRASLSAAPSSPQANSKGSAKWKASAHSGSRSMASSQSCSAERASLPAASDGGGISLGGTPRGGQWDLNLHEARNTYRSARKGAKLKARCKQLQIASPQHPTPILCSARCRRPSASKRSNSGDSSASFQP
mmetsp:Transcript_119466/g.381143  ORF Transcript_119466/g.381143 Transcript_119466/m.381143 type:complete len:215 (-) Transcript_119466:270-914(-)